MKFVLEIDLDNDAMQSSHALAGAISDLAERIAISGYVESVKDEIVRGVKDENGNTVGSWKICK